MDLQRMFKFNSDVMHMMVPLMAESGTVPNRSNVMNMTSPSVQPGNVLTVMATVQQRARKPTVVKA